MKDIIVFGTGKYFESKKETLAQKYHIVAFLDNKVQTMTHLQVQNIEITMMNPAEVDRGDTTKIFLMSVYFVSMWKQLCSIGVNPNRLIFPYMEQPYFENEDVLFTCLDKIVFSTAYFECFCKNGDIVRISTEQEWRAFLRKAYRQKYALIDVVARMSTTPISRRFGTERGTPIDRFYIERFLKNNEEIIQGDVLEIEDNTYTIQFGGAKVSNMLIMDVSSKDEGITFRGNLETGEGILDGIADCFILTQTLMYIFDLKKAVHNISRLLKKDGKVLITCSGISQNSMRCMDNYGCYFNFNQNALVRIFEDEEELHIIDSGSYGNVKTVTAHLNGLCCEDLKKEDFEDNDKYYPLIVYVVVEKK